MNRKIFEVVKLTNGYLATIIGINKDAYKVEIVNDKGKRKEITEINENDIKEVIVTKQKQIITFTKEKLQARSENVMEKKIYKEANQF